MKNINEGKLYDVCIEKSCTGNHKSCKTKMVLVVKEHKIHSDKFLVFNVSQKLRIHFEKEILNGKNNINWMEIGHYNMPIVLKKDLKKPLQHYNTTHHSTELISYIAPLNIDIVSKNKFIKSSKIEPKDNTKDIALERSKNFTLYHKQKLEQSENNNNEEEEIKNFIDDVIFELDNEFDIDFNSEKSFFLKEGNENQKHETTGTKTIFKEILKKIKKIFFKLKNKLKIKSNKYEINPSTT
jgi:hypothetical protein